MIGEIALQRELDFCEPMLRIERYELAVVAIDLHAIYLMFVVGVRPLNVRIGSRKNQLDLTGARVKSVQTSDAFITGM